MDREQHIASIRDGPSPERQTVPLAQRDMEADAPRPRLLRGMSAKLLLLTILFVMVGEVLIYVPSIANFRNTWLNDRIKGAQIATLVVEAAPDRMISEELRRDLLARAGAKAIASKRGGARHLFLASEEPFEIDAHYDLRDVTWFGAVTAAFETLASADGRTIRAIGRAPDTAGQFTEIVIDETPLRAAMLSYSINILTLSIVLSLIVAALIYFALHMAFVRPMRRLTRNMLRFSSNPEDTSRIISPTSRADEIGVAERELHHMQSELSGMLQQKSRLAALGLAVSKVSHDLRNMLASAQLISDRLSDIDDPTVQRVAPKLIASLDRAITLCLHTLKYGSAQEAPPDRAMFLLHELVEEIVEGLAPQASSRIVLYNDVLPDVEIDADREHLFRILMNLVRNAIEAIEAAIEVAPAREDGGVRVRAWREGAMVTIEVRDNGPGVPPRAREHLFEPFQSTRRSGGTGLGLAIAAELVRAHGGAIRLVDTDVGTAFWVSIPDRVAELRPGRRGERRSMRG